MTAAIGLSGKSIYFFKGFSFFFTNRIRENGTASKWVEAKFEVAVDPLPSLTTEADLPILVDVSFFFFYCGYEEVGPQLYVILGRR